MSAPTRADAITATLDQLLPGDARALEASGDDRTRVAVMACALSVALAHPHSTPGVFLAVRYGHGNGGHDRLFNGHVAVDFYGARNPIRLSWAELVAAWAKDRPAPAEPTGTLRVT